MPQYIIAASRTWYAELPYRLEKNLKQRFILINKKEDLTFERLQKIDPEYIFFPHWSSIIPPEIFDNFECVIFHMTDVPFGRGGSPLQNLIARGINETKISALRCQAGIDAGPVYMKMPLSLYGPAEEIFLRAAKIVEEMIIYIVKNKPTPTPQQGKVVYFPRRKPEGGNIAGLSELHQVYDYIRMLDANGYPNAFLETEYFKLEFSRASLKNGYLVSDVKITKKE